MADLSCRIPENVSGPIYVDNSCIYRDLCRALAPTIFREIGQQGWAAVFHQPATPDEFILAHQVIEMCPTESIGSDGESAA